MTLADGVLIKDNHLAALQGEGVDLRQAIKRARARAPHTVKIEVEVESLDQVRAALDADIDRILLDNFSLESVRAAVAARDAHSGKRLDLEVSGSIELEGLRTLAGTGIDFISVGALTKNVTAVDFSMRFL